MTFPPVQHTNVSLPHPRPLLWFAEKEQCDSPKFLEGVMKEHYPSIEWYTCSQVDGIPVLTPVDMTLQEFLDNRKA